LGETSTQNDAQVVDLQLHMAVKSLAVIQGEINCKLKELVKKTELITEKEEKGEESNSLLEMILDDLNELTELFNHRKSLRNQIEKLTFTVGTLTKTSY
jgi:hypothetical protein